MQYALVTDVVGVVRSLGHAGIRSIVASEYANSPTFRSRYCVERVVVPDMRDKEAHALQILLDVGARQKAPPVIMTGRESDVLLVSRHRTELAKHFLVKMPDAELMEALTNKWKFAQLTAKLGIPSPQSFRPKDEAALREAAREVGFPLILKPFSQDLWLREEIYAVVGHWKKACRVESLEELIRIYHALSAVHDEFLVQEFIPAKDNSMVILDAYCPEPGKVAGHFLGRKIRTYPIHFGQGCYNQSWSDDRITRLGIETLEKIGYVGPCNIDFMTDPRNGNLHVLEINARFSVWCHLSSRCGVNLPHAMFNDLTNQPLPRLAQDPREHRYIYFHFDLRSAKQYVAAGEWTWGTWFRSLLFPRITCFRWDWRDPMPLAAATFNYVSSRFSGLLRRLRIAGDRRPV